jgi:type IV pilus assembly protein PilO
MKLGIREILFFAAMLGLLGCAGFLLFGSDRQGQLRSEIEQKQRALNNVSLATVGIDDLSRKIDELQKAITFFESKLPREKEINTIVEDVSKMGDAHSLLVRSIKTLRTVPGPSYSEQPIQMHLSGGFNGFYSFLLQLEKLPRITRVTRMALSKINEGEMEAQMTLSIFFEPETRTRVAGVN